VRVALACTGLGHVFRGYEASVSELYASLRGKVDVELYQGAGAGPGKTCATTISRYSRLYGAWPLTRVNAYNRYRYESLSFAIDFLRRFALRPADVLFTPDHCLAILFKRLRRFFPGRPKLIFSNGAPFENSFCERFPAVHQKSYQHFKAADSILAQRSFFIPNGFDPRRLSRPDNFSVDDMRSRHRLPQSKYLILCLSAWDMTHKRVDWIIREASQLERDNFALVIAGQPGPDETKLKEMAHQLNVDCRFMTLDREEVPQLIWCADAMALGSLSEGFPRSVGEAMGSGLPVFVHPHENARWILGDDSPSLVDLTRRGQLADAIRRAESGNLDIGTMTERNYKRFIEKFSWDAVADKYVHMFEQVAYGALPGPTKSELSGAA